MKKVMSLLMILALALSLSACEKKKYSASSVEPKTAEYKNIYKTEDKNYKEEFKDSEGVVRYIIDYTYPVFSGKIDENAATTINDYFQNEINKLIRSAEGNIENYAEFQKKFNIEKPTTHQITFTIYYCDKNVISIIMSEKEASDLENAKAYDTGYTFRADTGERVTASDLYKIDATQAEEKLKAKIIEVANTNYSESGAAIDDEKIAQINNLFDEDNFVTDRENITFLYTLYEMSGGTREGTYYCDIPYESVTEFLNNI